MQSVALDSLSTICASERGDFASVAVMVNAACHDPEELRQFLVATIGHAGNLLRVAAHESGVSPDKIAGAVASAVREDAP
jgi:hypothetical protein